MTPAAGPHAAGPHAFVLAGGLASRMGGEDKARLRLHGEPLALLTRAALSPPCPSVTFIGRAPDAYADLGLPTLADLSPGAGPLSGLHRALTAACDLDPSGPPILLAACDLYGIQPAWVATLWRAALLHPGALAVAFCAHPPPQPPPSPPRARNPRAWEPLLALYSPRLLPLVCARLALPDRSDHALWRLLDACALPLPLPPCWPDLFVINTPDDLARARARP